MATLAGGGLTPISGANRSSKPRIPPQCQVAEPHQTRWALFFMRFQFTLTYRLKTKNGKADALSRRLDPSSTPSLPEPILPPTVMLAPIRWSLVKKSSRPSSTSPAVFLSVHKALGTHFAALPSITVGAWGTQLGSRRHPMLHYSYSESVLVALPVPGCGGLRRVMCHLCPVPDEPTAPHWTSGTLACSLLALVPHGSWFRDQPPGFGRFQHYLSGDQPVL